MDGGPGLNFGKRDDAQAPSRQKQNFAQKCAKRLTTGELTAILTAATTATAAMG